MKEGACAYISKDRGGTLSWALRDGTLSFHRVDADGDVRWSRKGVVDFHADLLTTIRGVRIAYAINGAHGVSDFRADEFLSYTPAPAGDALPSLIRFVAGSRDHVQTGPDGAVTVHRDATLEIDTIFVPHTRRIPIALDACRVGRDLWVAILYDDGWVWIRGSVVEQGHEHGAPLAIDAQTGARAYAVEGGTAIYAADGSAVLLAMALCGRGGRWLGADQTVLDLRTPGAEFRNGVPGAADDGAEFLVHRQAVAYTKHSLLSRVRGVWVRVLVIAVLLLAVAILRLAV